jgi:DNA-nicking Smr family endonuclease
LKPKYESDSDESLTRTRLKDVRKLKNRKKQKAKDKKARRYIDEAEESGDGSESESSELSSELDGFVDHDNEEIGTADDLMMIRFIQQ